MTISIHSLRMEGDQSRAKRGVTTIYFNPLPPHGGRRRNPALQGYSTRNFNPLPPHGGRLYISTNQAVHCQFQSTPSAWRETKLQLLLVQILFHFNPLPPHGGRPVCMGGADGSQKYFNPLPPHGGRPIDGFSETVCIFISIHSLRMEGDSASSARNRSFSLFQSTPSAWRETSIVLFWIAVLWHFNPLPPHGGRHLYFHQSSRALSISIHSLRMEGDLSFLSFLSIFLYISIHSLRMEGDAQHADNRTHNTNISIHSLRMEGDSKTAQESVFHFAYPCTILQKRMQKTTFCTRKNGFFRKKGEKFGAKPSASFCAPMIRTDTFPLNFSHRISGSSMSMVSFAPICSTFD